MAAAAVVARNTSLLSADSARADDLPADSIRQPRGSNARSVRDIDPVQIESSAAQKNPRWKLPYRSQVARVYDSTCNEVFICACIVLNFVVTIVDKQIDPRNNLYHQDFKAIYDAFNVLFLIEFITHVYARGAQYWRSPFNVFDGALVISGVLYVASVPTAGDFVVLRVVRAARILKLIARVPALKRIVVALVRAVPAVTNAILILFGVTSMYAIIATDYFAAAGDGGVMQLAEVGNYSVGTTSDLQLDGLPYWLGDEYFGDWSKSFFTLIQIITADNWGAIARPLLSSDAMNTFMVAFFFVSYILFVGIVLVNVIIGFLIEKILDNRGDTGREAFKIHGHHRGHHRDGHDPGREEDTQDEAKTAAAFAELLQEQLVALDEKVTGLAEQARVRDMKNDEQLAKLLLLTQQLVEKREFEAEILGRGGGDGGDRAI